MVYLTFPTILGQDHFCFSFESPDHRSALRTILELLELIQDTENLTGFGFSLNYLIPVNLTLILGLFMKIMNKWPTFHNGCSNYILLNLLNQILINVLFVNLAKINIVH